MMAFRNSSSVFFLGFVLLILGVVDAAVAPSHPIHIVRRSSFPKGFVFGSSSSAYQYEGAAFKYGKGLSIWDIYTHQHSDRIKNHSNGDVAVDSYHRYKEDVAIMKQIGFDVYRFSIAWTRILPKGKLSGGVNKEGIEYYNNLIKELLANGITPYITLFHWDVPQVLQDEYQGFMNESIVNDFRDYVELCFKEFGDRVKHWITMNEQYIFSLVGYALGINAPGRCSSWQPNNCLGGDSGTEPYIVGHNQILAHAAAVKVYKTKYQAHQKGVIGISLASDWYIPYSDNNEADKEAASRALDFALGWFLHPIVYGDYPPIMRTLVKERLPNFTREEITLITESFDFIGMNYYSASYAKDDPNPVGPNSSYLTDYRAILTTERNYPEGLYDMLMHIKTKYKDPIIVITENGYKDNDSPKVHELIKDRDRVKYLHDHLLKLHKAIKAGVRVKGYCVWSLFDNFEWANGYTLRYGMVYIDFKHQLKRILKESANWFHNFLST